MAKRGKKKNTKNLNKKLLAYSMTAGGILAMAPASNAGIVHTDPADINLGVGGSQDINLCTLCGPEFQIMQTISTVGIYHIGTGTGTGTGWMYNNYGTSFPVRNMWTNNTIGPGTNFTLSGGVLNQYQPPCMPSSPSCWCPPCYLTTVACSTSPTYTYGPCTPQTNGSFYYSEGYIGVRFECAGNTYYGWIHYTGEGGFSGTIHDWAYEDVPNTPILSGDTNTAPEVDLNGGGAGNDTTGAFTEDGGPVAIAPAGTVTDAEGDTIQTVTIALTNNLDGPGVEALWLGAAANVAIGGSGTDTITLTNTGTTTNAQFTAALQAITYDNTSDTPDTTDRAITVVANDGAEAGVVRTVTMSVIENNDPPTDITLVPADVNENSPVNTAVGTLNTTDPDG